MPFARRQLLRRRPWPLDRGRCRPLPGRLVEGQVSAGLLQALARGLVQAGGDHAFLGAAASPPGAAAAGHTLPLIAAAALLREDTELAVACAAAAAGYCGVAPLCATCELYQFKEAFFHFSLQAHICADRSQRLISPFVRIDS